MLTRYVTVLQGNIAKYIGKCIINAANRKLKTGGGMDGAIGDSRWKFVRQTDCRYCQVPHTYAQTPPVQTNWRGATTAMR